MLSLGLAFMDLCHSPCSIRPEALNEQQLRNLGINAYSCELQQGDVLYTPSGFVVFERCVGELTHGLRKSFFYPTTRGHKNYVKAMEMLKDVKGLLPAKMEDISRIWQASAGEQRWEVDSDACKRALAALDRSLMSVSAVAECQTMHVVAVPPVPRMT